MDGNGLVTEYDAKLLALYLAGNAELTEGQKSRGDLNGDGVLSARDVTLILRKIS